MPRIGRAPSTATESLLSELGAFQVAIGLAVVALVSYLIADAAGPAAGVAFGAAFVVAVSVAEAVRHIRQAGGRSGGLRDRGFVAVALPVLLVVLALVVAITVAFDSPLPVLAWVGFGVVAFAVLSLALAIVGLVASDPAGRGEGLAPRALAADGHHRVLLVADAELGEEAWSALTRRVAGHSTLVHVVAPVLTSQVAHWTSADDDARVEAERRLETLLDELAPLGIAADGEVGPDDPFQAIDDALRTFAADEILLVSSNPATWAEDGLAERGRRALALPVTQLAAASG